MNPDSFVAYRTAAEGAAFLDRNGPEDWYMKVTTSTLEQNDGTKCVLAQLYGTYFDGLDRLRLVASHPAFDGTVLASDWIEEINKRRNVVMSMITYPEKRDSDVELQPGRTYRFTVEAVHIGGTSTNHHFRDDTGDPVAFNKDKVANVEEVNTHEVKAWDVYIRNGDPYRIEPGPDHAPGGLVVVRPGYTDRFTNVPSHRFTADELIYRKDS